MCKHFRNKMQMEMETPSLMSGSYTCMSPQLLYLKKKKIYKTKIQRSLFCILFYKWLAVLHLPIYLLWITSPKSSVQGAEDEISLTTARWACSSSHRISFSPCPHCTWVLQGTARRLGKTPSCPFLCLNRVGGRREKKKNLFLILPCIDHHITDFSDL